MTTKPDSEARRGLQNHVRMRRRFLNGLLVFAAMVVVVVSRALYTRTLSYIHGAEERTDALWMAALKGFEGPVYYVGSEGEFSYFRAGKYYYSRYKARTSKIQLPRTFLFGTEEPCSVNQGMVARY